QEKLLGKEKFHKAMDLYFDRHDGQAVTCDDFVQCMEDTSGKDMTQFKRWYSQAGTPEVTAFGKYDAKTKTYELTLSQETPATVGQPTKEPFVIPQEIGLVGSDGKDMPLQLEGEKSAKDTSRVLTLENGTQTFKFMNVEEPPVLSTNRGFTAPIKLHVDYTNDEYIHLMQHDSDDFSRFEAGQQYAAKIMLNMVKEIQAGKEPTVDDKFIKAMGSYLKEPKLDKKAFIAKAMELPVIDCVAQRMEVIDIGAIDKARGVLQKAIANEYKKDFYNLYQINKNPTEVEYTRDGSAMFKNVSYKPDVKQAGERSLKNCALSYLSKTDDKDMQKLAATQYKEASNMTDTIAALTTMIGSNNPEKDHHLNHFYTKHEDNPLIVNKWLEMQSTASRADTVDTVKKLAEHKGFTNTNPNKVTALLDGFARNQVAFHVEDGSGYDFLAEQLIKLDDVNPMVAARTSAPLLKWQNHNPERQELMKNALEKVLQKPNISPNLYELVSAS
ncbi:MAG: DUF3458 domain-containing protein, partial [Alphaproteobacteria bacterium]|nr:DUF3458 domain-containing protein [Alphaproteobacteria bacterium]